MTKVFLGLSGGVDSAVAAHLLKEQGYDVTCGFMRNWDSLTNGDIKGNPDLDDPVCTQEQDYLDAKKVADQLGLPLLRADFIEEYWNNVFQEFLSEYRKGRTPNPDILCNRYIKFDSFYDFARKNGFELLATGHYAKIGSENGHAVLMKADDRNKDQSYFLGEVNRGVFDHVLFPLGNMDKPEVRRIAEELNLAVAEKKDSTGICFIGERNFRQFLSNYLPMKPGVIRCYPGREIIGEHQGVLYYTIGQRKGLNIGGTGPYVVIGKNVEKNELYVARHDHLDLLYSDSCRVDAFNVLADRELPLNVAAKFRYRQKDNPIILAKEGNSYFCRYPQKVASVTPGQEAVVYDGDTVIGGGRIEAVYQNGDDLMEMIRRYFD